MNTACPMSTLNASYVSWRIPPSPTAGSENLHRPAKKQAKSETVLNFPRPHAAAILRDGRPIADYVWLDLNVRAPGPRHEHLRPPPPRREWRDAALVR